MLDRNSGSRWRPEDLANLVAQQSTQECNCANTILGPSGLGKFQSLVTQGIDENKKDFAWRYMRLTRPPHWVQKRFCSGRGRLYVLACLLKWPDIRVAPTHHATPPPSHPAHPPTHPLVPPTHTTGSFLKCRSDTTSSSRSRMSTSWRRMLIA